MISRAFLLPTGGEIRDGTVLDLDCPRIMEQLVRMNPEMVITRLAPLLDVEENIAAAMQRCVDEGAELIVLVGGSGGGHRFSDRLSEDYTHSAMERWLEQKTSKQIYGKNGHMWTNLVCGTKDGCLVVNVPGPLREAAAAIEAFVKSAGEPPDIFAINQAMTEAVLAQYPQDKVHRDG